MTRPSHDPGRSAEPGCKACRVLEQILGSAARRHRAFESWAYDTMYDVLHAEVV